MLYKAVVHPASADMKTYALLTQLNYYDIATANAPHYTESPLMNTTVWCRAAEMWSWFTVCLTISRYRTIRCFASFPSVLAYDKVLAHTRFISRFTLSEF